VVAVAVLPHQLVGERLRREEQHLCRWLGEVRHGEADIDANVPIRRFAFLRESSSSATRNPRRPAVARRLAAHPASSLRPFTPPPALIFLERELHAFLVRLEGRRGNTLVRLFQPRRS